MLLLVACSTTTTGLAPVASAPPLDVPPDLSIPKSDAEFGVPEVKRAATYSATGAALSGAGTAPADLLQVPSGMRLERAGTGRWLVVPAESEKVWVALHAFFQNNKLPLAAEYPRVGILETEWTPLAEAVETLDNGLPGVRDKYRVRLERGEAPATTEIYVSHYSVMQVGDKKHSEWQLRAPDADAEAAMLRRIMLYLGASPAQAGAALAGDPGKVSAELVNYSRGLSVVRLSGDMDNAWRRVGIALDRVGFVVEDRDRSKGLYYVRATDAVKDAAREKKSLFSWFQRKKVVADRYQVSLKTLAASGKGPAVEVEVLDANGVAETGAVGKRLVQLLFDQLK
jgi:outer membrane protein assembly factor BamC